MLVLRVRCERRTSLTVNGGCWHARPMGIYATLKRLADGTQAGATDFGRGIQAHSRALLSQGKTVGRSWRARGSRETVGAAPRGPGAVVGVRAPRRAGLGAVCGVRVAAPRPCGCASVLPASPRPAAACP